jgi:hypothetical protein
LTELDTKWKSPPFTMWR